ncbi:MAG: HNH endonuclease [Lachnospiraceae bacterium]|nr:HNH endonuclease [Lachnospiraceae bacterium]
MGNSREFSDSVKLEVIKNNLKANQGSICCEICRTKLNSIDECHFDHIYPFAKGGKSTLENCQILCSECNLRKNDKELQDFMLEEKAKQFLAGMQLGREVAENPPVEQETVKTEDNTQKLSKKLTKEEFDREIQNFINRKGDIHKVDFSREYNHLPSVWYVREYYGDLNSLKKAFGIEDISQNWTRENIKQVLLDYVETHGDVTQKDLKKRNGLPSCPCIMRNFPECGSFSTFKKEVLGIQNGYKVWTKEEVLESGIAFVKAHGSLTEKDLKAKNGLATSKVIYKFFGSLTEYQRAIGAPVMDVTAFITKEAIEKAVDDYFGDRERVVDSRKTFFATFPYKPDVIYKRYGSFDEFCAVTGIKFLKVKKASYSKKEIDDAVHRWIFSGNEIPLAKDLTKCGLPSMGSIMRFYESWREPFVLYKKIYDEANRNQ